MSTFFEKNKRKSVLALLLLLLKWRKGLAPLLLMVFLVMFIFILPANLLGVMLDGINRLPGGTRVAAGITFVMGKLGLRRSGKQSFEDLLAAFKAAKDRGRPLGSTFRPGGALGPNSIDMVKGGRDYLNETAPNAEKSLKGGQSVSGILTKEDADDGEPGVALGAEDLAAMAGGGGLVESANAQMGAGAGRGLPSGSGGSSGLSGASKAFLAGSGPNAAVDSGRSDKTMAALDSGKVGAAGTPKTAGQHGKISAKNIRSASTSNANASRRGIRAGSRALAQLADGRARTQIARDPYCTPAQGCPGEFAASNVGAVYDGNRIGGAAPGVITTVPAVDGMSVPTVNPPSQGNLDALNDEARRLQEEAEQCQKAAAVLDTRKNAIDKKMTAYQNEFNSAGCGDSGGCDESKAKKCKKIGAKMKSTCKDMDDARKEQYDNCPLMQRDGPFEPNKECDK